MKLCLVGHGSIAIPPLGRGAIETIIWDQKYWLEQLGHQCLIVNTSDQSEIVSRVNAFGPDVVQFYCERHFPLANYVNARLKLVNSQWPLLFKTENAAMARRILSGDWYVNCSTQEIRDYCQVIGVRARGFIVTRNGAFSELVAFKQLPEYPDRSICAAIVNDRKRQYLIKDFDSIDFAGPISSPAPSWAVKNYLGEWSRQHLYSHLTDYANLVLLSESEVAPLSTCEALQAGLGLVVSQAAAANLDRAQCFIDVVDECTLHEPNKLAEIIEKNRNRSRGLREAVRAYGIESFDVKVIAREFMDCVANIVRLKA